MATQQVFIALQCFQCSTMQVKQQKKSSNKWVCAVCNQRQSVRKVFSRGHLARDVRGFVQRFNMSRRVAPPGADARASPPPPPPGNGGCPRPRRTDWSEYLDPVEEDGFAADESNDVISGFPEVVTEMPTEMRSLPKRPQEISALLHGRRMPSSRRSQSGSRSRPPSPMVVHMPCSMRNPLCFPLPNSPLASHMGNARGWRRRDRPSGASTWKTIPARPPKERSLQILTPVGAATETAMADAMTLDSRNRCLIADLNDSKLPAHLDVE